MKKLKAPIGSEGANIGTTLFKLDPDGNVIVPDDAVQTLVGVGGFEIVADIPDAPEGQTVLRSVVGSQSCSFGDQSFSTDGNGYVTVPTALVDSLLSHGFVVPAVVVAIAEELVAAEAQQPEEPAEVIDIPAIPIGTVVPAAAGETAAPQPATVE
ncbi:hypothetical protein [Rhizobium sp. RCAM05973]|uniref:hypothetical protein n=1 Tax=Rhizobium sp. RCAM05973 TaxID=2994066 RepID=UPI0022EBA453|nr:hypothetical protein [Rhizobium sp. RCAM05973]